MSELTKLINIGPVLEEKLLKANISTTDKLIQTGSKGSFFLIKSQVDTSACLNVLYALEGAIQQVRSHNLPNKTKEELKTFFRTF